MGTIGSNRDLYLAIAGLVEAHKGTQRTLEEYLRALWWLGRDRRGDAGLSPDDFVSLLTLAFSILVPPFEDAWRDAYGAAAPAEAAFGEWEAAIHRQIVDLREMGEQGTLSDEMRYFGVDSPRGSRWYNFDPCTFLECGMAGSFGGWEPGDPTGREFVPGEVVVLGPEGELRAGSPEGIDRPIVRMVELTWEDFTDFLYCGQSYE